jgi:hypothetical protein
LSTSSLSLLITFVTVLHLLLATSLQYIEHANATCTTQASLNNIEKGKDASEVSSPLKNQSLHYHIVGRNFIQLRQ